MNELSTNHVPIHTSDFISNCLAKAVTGKKKKALQKVQRLCMIKGYFEVDESIITSETMDCFLSPV